MYKLRNTKRNYELNIPTRFSEIDFDAILEVLSNVEVSEHYAIISLSQSFGAFQLATLGAKNSKDMNVPVSVNFVKANDPNNKIKAKTGDKVIVSRSDIEMSVHLPIKFGLSTGSIGAVINECPDARTALHQGPVDEKGNPVKELIAVEFKLVPLSAIKAVIDVDKKVNDVYRTTIAVAN